MPEKSGIDAMPWLRSCVSTDEENRTVAEAVAMINVRVMEFFPLSGDDDAPHSPVMKSRRHIGAQRFLRGKPNCDLD
jgi:hypothetical protein